MAKPTGGPQDLQNATNIHAGIASQILSASLVLIGILIGYFDLKNIDTSSGAGKAIIVAIVLLLISFISGALGLKKMRNNGGNANWDYTLTHPYFRIQTLLNFAAIVIFVFVTFSSSKSSDQEKILEKIEITLTKMATIDSMQNERMIYIDSMQTEIMQNCCQTRIEDSIPTK